MNIAIVTSEVTYIPQNYNSLIGPLLESGSICLFINLKNKSPTLILKAIGLITLGAKNIGLQLLKNVLFPQTSLRKKLCQKNSIEYICAQSINNKIIIDLIKTKKIDIIFNLRTREIYRKEVLEAPKLGCINLHHGILPNYRGTMCDLYALYEGRFAGFSLHRMSEKVDAGDIYKVKEVQKDEKNYLKYLGSSHVEEFNAIENLINEIKLHKSLPQGHKNIRTNKCKYTKNPTEEIIKKMLEKGMIL